MIDFKNLATVLFVAVVCFFVYVEASFATSPPTPPYTTVWGDSLDGLRAIQINDLPYFPRRDLDNYIGQFERTCEFLDSMQEHNEDDPNYGGMHEGEGNNLWRIVETDNTQEAIRVWCEYAVFFEDPDIYRDNINAAWTYCDNFPAWEESEPGEMYGLHNSGWGLIAEMAFRGIYDESHREYGLNCANHLVEYTPDIEPNMEDNLMPLVAGWAAGTLYEYGIFEDNEEYCDAALHIGLDVKEWIDADPDRLHANEIWALCGGTAMWGVIRSLGRNDSAETADWVIERLDEMDVFSGNGRWNNSWNIWYSHAWLSAWRLVGNDDYCNNVIAIVDSLIAQDSDADGGIPATAGNPNNRDESWVSCYTAWMGLRQLFDILPSVDASVVQLLDPSLERPWPIESPMRFTFHLINAGGLEQIDVPFHLRGPIEFDTTVTLE
ncbi:MAG: hypothetical protein P9M15_02805, partial [Candidatus Electryoneaceae bacterium]|nr:hypothetical protein [Candidatus Electryoneaceae bacterium]